MFKVISYPRSKSQNASRNKLQGNCGRHGGKGGPERRHESQTAQEHEVRSVSPLKRLRKRKTTINYIVTYYHDKVTHPDEVHEEHVVQLPYR